MTTDTPPTATELRDAAELWLAHVRPSYMPEIGYDDLPPSLTAATKCAAHILATVRADDHEPVTTEWLISVGLWKEPEDYYDEVVGFSFRFNLIAQAVITTKGTRKGKLYQWSRGSIRTICRILGRTLNEVPS